MDHGFRGIVTLVEARREMGLGNWCSTCDKRMFEAACEKRQASVAGSPWCRQRRDDRL